MKKIVYLFAALSAMTFSGCSDDDDAGAAIDPALYEGPWALINVSGSIAGVDNDLNGIIWDFNTDEDTVTVTNNYEGDETVEDFFESGTYDVSFVPTEGSGACSLSLEVDQTDLGCMDANGGAMTLTQQAADGYTLTFEKVMPFN